MISEDILRCPKSIGNILRFISHLETLSLIRFHLSMNKKRNLSNSAANRHDPPWYLFTEDIVLSNFMKTTMF